MTSKNTLDPCHDSLVIKFNQMENLLKNAKHLQNPREMMDHQPAYPIDDALALLALIRGMVLK